MANLQYGDTIKYLPSTTMYATSITNVVPVRYGALDEGWVVCAQKDATHMLITMNAVDQEDKDICTAVVIEIGKCENLYLLADAIVE